jgi:tetratricopeptide (TPR) repeat protein
VAWACKECTVSASIYSWMNGGDAFDCKSCRQPFCGEVAVAVARKRLVELERLVVESPPPDDVYETTRAALKRDLAIALANYGRQLDFASSAQRKIYAEAERFCRASLSQPGLDPLAEAEFRLAVGEICRYRRRLAESVRLLRSTMELTSRPDLRDTARAKQIHEDAVEDLGNALSSLGQYSEAEMLLRRSLASVMAVEGPDGRSTTQGYACLATVLRRMGGTEKLVESLRLTWRVAANWQRILGADHEKTTSACQYIRKIETQLCRQALADGCSQLLHAE